jgi:ectoine hydroxylase-related dioxygenase (phytanoyl-CoA dioxygenase family)
MQAYENDYLFDLLGYRVLEQAISPDQVQRIKRLGRCAAAAPTRRMGGQCPCAFVSGARWHQLPEHRRGRRCFEEMMDNPAWFGAVSRYIVNDFNRLSIQENFSTCASRAGLSASTSGGHIPAAIFSTRHHTGAWNVGQINILMALSDIGPGDGATVVVPGSHKSHMPHPAVVGGEQQVYRDDVPASEGLMTQEVHLKKGDALMFTDAITHGSSQRVNAGQRRVMIYRYTPHSIMPRFNYVPSPELLARLTPQRRALIEATPMRLAPGRTLG